MNPARSLDRITCLASPSRANASARLAVSSLVSSDVTTSTRLRTGTGLKKWMPITDAGRLVAMASFMIGMDEVLEARMASSSATTRSSRSNTASFTGSDSLTASTTSCRSARSS